MSVCLRFLYMTIGFVVSAHFAGLSAAVIPVGGGCSLVDAITAANDDMAVGGCAPGSGADTLILSEDVTLTASDNEYVPFFTSFGFNGLPVVKTTITIEGQGHIISRSGGAIDNFRLFLVDGQSFAGHLTLVDVTLANGLLVGAGDSVFSTLEFSGGAILAHGGTVIVRDSILTGNRADNGGALLLVFNSQGEFSNVELSVNEAVLQGGAILNFNGGLTGDRVRFADNMARQGGAMVNRGTTSLADSSFLRNEAEQGGAIYNHTFTGQASLVNALFQTNKARSFGVGSLGGGAIYNFNAPTMTLRNSRLAGNLVDGIGDGGAIHTSNNSTLFLIDSEVVENLAGTFGSGGGIFNGQNGRLIIEGSHIGRNSAERDGGGVFSSINNPSSPGLTAAITASRIADNQAGRSGGGIYNSQSRMTLERVSVTGNLANRDGGGIVATNPTANAYLLDIQDSTIADNGPVPGTTNLQGGGLHVGDFTVDVVGSTISGNLASGGAFVASSGGGLYVAERAAVRLADSTVSGNTAAGGGGGFHVQSSSTLELSHVTITGNSAPAGNGGALRSINSPAATVTSSLFEANVGGNCDTFFPLAEFGVNLLDDGSCTGVATAGPYVAGLADNGGASPTHALVAGSPALDATGAGCPDVADLDQRGAVRDLSCDSGAFEAGSVLPTMGFELAESSVAEGTDATIDLILNLDNTAGNLGAGLIKAWLVLTGTAAFDADYGSLITLPLEITMPAPGTASDTPVSLTLNDDVEVEGTETLVVDLIFAGPATLGGPARHIVTILDNDGIALGACEALQAELQDQQGDEDPDVYRNHGAYVSPVARATSQAVESNAITEECAGCIVNQFARNVLIAEQTICNGSQSLITARGLPPISLEPAPAAKPAAPAKKSCNGKGKGKNCGP